MARIIIRAACSTFARISVSLFSLKHCTRNKNKYQCKNALAFILWTYTNIRPHTYSIRTVFLRHARWPLSETRYFYNGVSIDSRHSHWSARSRTKHKTHIAETNTSIARIVRINERKKGKKIYGKYAYTRGGRRGTYCAWASRRRAGSTTRSGSSSAGPRQTRSRRSLRRPASDAAAAASSADVDATIRSSASANRISVVFCTNKDAGKCILEASCERYNLVWFLSLWLEGVYELLYVRKEKQLPFCKWIVRSST